jgi:hemoglobin-like flavoprotein
MTPRDIELVKATFERAAAMRPSLGERLYAKLFESQPELAQLFRGDTAHQAHTVVDMLDTIIGCLEVQDRVVPLVFELGRRHCSYGVRSGHYQVFGDALLGALQEELGADFGAEERAAWQSAYRFMAEIMGEATLD